MDQTKGLSDSQVLEYWTEAFRYVNFSLRSGNNVVGVGLCLFIFGSERRWSRMRGSTAKTVRLSVFSTRVDDSCFFSIMVWLVTASNIKTSTLSVWQ